MAKFTLEIEDTDKGGFTLSLKADSLTTIDAATTNTSTQNLAILIVSVLRKAGVGELCELPKIDQPKCSV